MSLEEKENRPDLPDILIAFQPESSDFYFEHLAGLLAFLLLTPSHLSIVAFGFQLFRSKNFFLKDYSCGDSPRFSRGSLLIALSFRLNANHLFGRKLNFFYDTC